MSALSVLPAEFLQNILHLGKVKEEGNTAHSQALGSADDLPSSTSRLSQAKDKDSTAIPQDSNSAQDPLHVPPSILQLRQAKDEGVTITLKIPSRHMSLRLPLFLSNNNGNAM